MSGKAKLLPGGPAPGNSNLLLCSVFTVLALLSPLTGLAAELDESELQRAAQNPVLWSHFRSVARDTHSYLDGFGRKYYRRHPNLEGHTEMLIEGFLKQVNRQSEQLVSAADRLAQLQPQNGSPGYEQELDAALKDLDKTAGNLRQTLAPVYFRLNRNGRPAKVGADEKADIQALTRLVFSTFRAVDGYVLQGRHTATVHRLKNENMLFSLARIQELAKRLRPQ